MDPPGETYPACPTRKFPHSLLEPCHRFRRQAPFRLLVIREAEPQELPFPWSSHRTLLAVHSKLELRREESRHAAHHSFRLADCGRKCCSLIPLRGPFGPSLLAQLLRPLLTS